MDGVGSTVTEQIVVAQTALNEVVARTAADGVGQWSAKQPVVAEAAINRDGRFERSLFKVAAVNARFFKVRGVGRAVQHDGTRRRIDRQEFKSAVHVHHVVTATRFELRVFHVGCLIKQIMLLIHRKFSSVLRAISVCVDKGRAVFLFANIPHQTAEFVAVQGGVVSQSHIVRHFKAASVCIAAEEQNAVVSVTTGEQIAGLRNVRRRGRTEDRIGLIAL